MVADAHLGYAWAQRRRGELGPLADGGMAEKLHALLDDLAPQELVFLGDVVHAPKPAPGERALIEAVLGGLAERVPVRVVRGNHDRSFARDFPNLGLTVESEYRTGDLVAVHGDRPPAPASGHTVLGHFHPSVVVLDAAGHKQKLRVFAVSETATILPAFSPFAAGFNLRKPWPAELQAWLETKTRVRTIAVTGTRVVELPFRKA